jgi:hypothetical protein
MRTRMMITNLDAEQWDYLHRNVRTEYEVPAGATRACLIFSREGEERHAEMSLAALVGLLVGLSMAGATRTLRAAMAALTPDALPDELEAERNAADPAHRGGADK